MNDMKLFNICKLIDEAKFLFDFKYTYTNAIASTKYAPNSNGDLASLTCIYVKDNADITPITIKLNFLPSSPINKCLNTNSSTIGPTITISTNAKGINIPLLNNSLSSSSFCVSLYCKYLGNSSINLS